MRTAATIVFTGNLNPASFTAFAEHRAARLALTLRWEAVNESIAVVSVDGAPDLVDAFELACSLGPQDCVIRDVARRHPSSSAFA